MKRVLKNINGIATEVLTWGDPFRDGTENVIVCITGNPGLPDFYIDFATELYESLQIPICIIGHAGHIDISSESFCTTSQDGLFNLRTQVDHKLDLLKNHLCKKSKLHLIGHSIGAWIIVEILQKNDYLMERLSSVNLLFPTLQRLADTRNGIFFNNSLRKFYIFVLFLVRLLYLLPNFIARFLIYLHFKFNSLPYEYIDCIVKLRKPSVIENILYMAFDEMDIVQDLNSYGMAKIKHLTNVIYGENDGWAPIEYIDDLRRFEPCLKMKLADNIEHAFILRSSEAVASMVAEFIQLKI